MQGYAIDNEENGLGIRCVAAPIFNHLSSVIAAVCMFSSTAKIPDWQIASLGGEMVGVAKDISRDLNGSALANNEQFIKLKDRALA